MTKLTTKENAQAATTPTSWMSDLRGVAVEQAVAPAALIADGGEHAGEERAGRAAHAVDAHDVERVVEAELGLEPDAEVAQRRRR